MMTFLLQLGLLNFKYPLPPGLTSDYVWLHKTEPTQYPTNWGSFAPYAALNV